MIYQNAIITNDANIWDGSKRLPFQNVRIKDGNLDLVHMEGLQQNLASARTDDRLEVDGTSFYAGIRYHHYGHFLLESLSRLSNYNGENNIIWNARSPGFKSWQLEILNLFGMSDKKHVFVTGEAKVKSLSLTQPNYVIWDKFTDSHAQHLAIVESEAAAFSGRSVWLSRAGYKTFNNEHILEAVLARHGWLIVHPAELSVTSQAKLFNCATKVAGVEGSAFHTMLLSKNVTKDITVFSRRAGGKFNGNFELISSVKGLNHQFLRVHRSGSGAIDLDWMLGVLEVEIDEIDREIIKALKCQCATS